MKAFLSFLALFNTGLLVYPVAPVILSQSAYASRRQAETLVCNEIKRILNEKNLAFRELELLQDYGAFGESIEILFPARDSSDEKKGLFVLAVPITGGVERNAESGLNWGHETAFELMDMLLFNPPFFDTIIYFAGDNWPSVSSAYPYAGLRALFNQINGREDAVLTYYDLSAQPDSIRIVKGMGESTSPLAIVEPFFEVCEKREIPCFFYTAATEIGDLTKEAGSVPVLYVSENSSAWLNALQTDKKISVNEAAGLIYEYAENVMRYKVSSAADAPGNEDRNYAHIAFNRENIFIPEYTLVVITLFTSVFLCFICVFLFCAAKSRIKRMIIYVFTFVLFLSLFSFIVLYTSTGKSTQKITKKPQFAAENDTSELYFMAGIEVTPFLERQIAVIDINAIQTPLHYRLFFIRHGTGKNDYFIYDAPMPYETSDGQTEFMLGDYPPAYLDLEIALPHGISGDFVIEAVFEDGSNIIQKLPCDSGF
ncbi:MAG: hypothetical protein LBH18_03170 [Spirochaetaceae bacterium]|nr:hypothetical protein [Spirochaetaceae bacterium]